jgi:putative Mg2+ transporter-C (MgtC) family protein
MAVLSGIIIGVERQLTGHPAGVRINTLVSLGACVFVLFSMVIKPESADLSRVAAQIVSGVGFLCSGIIFKDGTSVRGLNTAATIWCSAAIGVLASTGEYIVVFAATAVLLLVNLLLRPFANWLEPLECFDETENMYSISVICMETEEIFIREKIMNYITEARLKLVKLESNDMIGGKVEVEAVVSCRGRKRNVIAEKLITRLSIHKSVIGIGWKTL